MAWAFLKEEEVKSQKMTYYAWLGMDLSTGKIFKHKATEFLSPPRRPASAHAVPWTELLQTHLPVLQVDRPPVLPFIPVARGPNSGSQDIS